MSLPISPEDLHTLLLARLDCAIGIYQGSHTLPDAFAAAFARGMATGGKAELLKFAQLTGQLQLAREIDQRWGVTTGAAA